MDKGIGSSMNGTVFQASAPSGASVAQVGYMETMPQIDTATSIEVQPVDTLPTTHVPDGNTGQEPADRILQMVKTDGIHLGLQRLAAGDIEEQPSVDTVDSEAASDSQEARLADEPKELDDTPNDVEELGEDGLSFSEAQAADRRDFQAEETIRQLQEENAVLQGEVSGAKEQIADLKDQVEELRKLILALVEYIKEEKPEKKAALWEIILMLFLVMGIQFTEETVGMAKEEVKKDSTLKR